ncbi:hypothetical protein ACIG3E_32630 [Streptomyces sp. NPDC053474]|uniref:hypothetical protein n=1 Tax=Streptomyces sp. NPDC053474 TaxID=3365704 RepID=UPI0037D07B09
MDARQRETRQQIRHRLAGASRELLLRAVLDVLETTGTAQHPPDRNDYGIGGWRDRETVEAEHRARIGLAEDVDTAVHAALNAGPTTPA